MSYNKKSESFGNIKKAFGDEAAGHVRYMILSENAEKDGNFELARLYSHLSAEELCHARRWYAEQGEGNGLTDSISEESTEASHTYPQYAARAEMEGYEELADRFLANGQAEAGHHERLMRYLDSSKNGTGYVRNEDVLWRCGVCGYRHIGTTPPDTCPLCDRNLTAFTVEEDL